MPDKKTYSVTDTKQYQMALSRWKTDGGTESRRPQESSHLSPREHWALLAIASDECRPDFTSTQYQPAKSTAVPGSPREATSSSERLCT